MILGSNQTKLKSQGLVGYEFPPVCIKEKLKLNINFLLKYNIYSVLYIISTC